MPRSSIVVAATGPTGTIGAALMSRLEAHPAVSRVVGLGRRPFDPAVRGWSKLEYRRGDVRDPNAVDELVRGADVVVHLAFVMTGMASRATIRAVNLDGTRNVLQAAKAASVTRFVHASSVGVYGHHPDNPLGMTEDWPVRPAVRLFYEQQKVELERLLGAAAAEAPQLELYLLRPAIVVGPNAVGTKDVLPGALAPVGRLLAELVIAAGVLPKGLPMPAPSFPMQLVHEDDVARAFVSCIVGAGPPGAYNVAADDAITVVDLAAQLGAYPLPVPDGALRAAARTLLRSPVLNLMPAFVEWIEWWAQPTIVDSSKAARQLDWSPRYSSLEAVQDMVDTGLRATATAR